MPDFYSKQAARGLVFRILGVAFGLAALAAVVAVMAWG